MSPDVELHHVNVPAYDLAKMVDFYQGVLELDRFVPERVDPTVEFGTAFLSGSAGQIHLTPPRPTLLFKNGMGVNPVLRGHIAFRATNLDAIKNRLRRAGVQFADYGEWAIKGWHQMFFYDPEGNVIEIHQVEGKE